MASKTNSKPCQRLRWSFFHKIVTGFRGKLKMLPNILDGTFYKNSQKLKRFWICFWIGFQSSRYTNADMKICQYLRLYIKSKMPKVSHYNTLYFLRYVQPRWVKCLFANTHKQWNTSKISLIFKKNTNFTSK